MDTNPGRDKWTFQFTVGEILRAAESRLAHHAERKLWWSQEQDKAIVAAKKGGVEIREYEVTGGKRADVILDPTLGNRLSECSNKVQRHRASQEEFGRWVAVLSAQDPARVYDLAMDDALYFGVAKNEAEP